MTWDLQGTEKQKALVQAALDACDFPFDRLDLSSVGRTAIPVEWADLSRYNTIADAEGHKHVHINGDTGHVLEARERVLGLAWYSGKVSLDLSLERDPALAQEVFLAEGAHMVDFFYMTEEERQAISLAFHGGDTTEHGHDWFDVGTYWEWVGEAFMGGFIVAFAPTVPVTIPFVHAATPEVGVEIRRILLREPSHHHDPVFASSGRRRVYHDSHKGVPKDRVFADKHEAEAAGYRACRVCKPQ